MPPQKRQKKLTDLLANALMQEILDEQLIEKLLSEGADINLPNNVGWTYLQHACIHNDIRLVERIIKIGANINYADVSGWAALHEASANGHLEIVKLLLAANANPHQFLFNANGDKRIPFDLASEQGHVDTALYLQNFCNEKYQDRWPPLHIAAYSRRTPLFSGCIGDRCFDAVKLLVKNNATINYPDKKGKTPLHAIAENGNSESVAILQLLMDNGADPNVIDKNGNTPLHLCKYLGRPFNLDIAMALIKNGADIYKKNNEGISSLQFYTSEGSSKSKELVAFMHKVYPTTPS